MTLWSGISIYLGPDSPQIAMPSDQKQELVRFIGAMLIEIVTQMTAQESVDDSTGER